MYKLCFQTIDLLYFSFSEAVSSPHPQVPQHAARFTFSESSGSTPIRPSLQGRSGGVEGMDETRVDLNLDQSAAESLSTHQNEQTLSITIGASQGGGSESVAVLMDVGEGTSSQVATKDAVAGPSSECTVPEVMISIDADQNGKGLIVIILSCICVDPFCLLLKKRFHY